MSAQHLSAATDPGGLVESHQLADVTLPAGAALAAARYIHSHATDPADEQELLLALGLIDPVGDQLDATA